MVYLLYKTKIRYRTTWKLVNSETGGLFGYYETAKAAVRDAKRYGMKAVRAQSIDGHGKVDEWLKSTVC